MDEFVYPLERTLRWRMEAAGPPIRPRSGRAAARQGARLLGVPPPAEAGGAGIPFMHYAHVNEILGRSPFGPACVGSQAPDSGNAEILWRFGDAEQKKRWLEPLVAGDIRSCFSMTEPEVAGSDPRWLRATAVRDGDHYVVNGHKWFSSGAHGAAFAIVMARRSPADPTRIGASAMIVVPTDTPGFRIERGITVMGEDDNHHAEIRYRGLPRPGRQSPRRGGVRVRDRPGAARARAHSSLHAVARRRGTRLRAHVPLRDRARSSSARRCRAKRTSRIGSPKREPTSTRHG